MQLPLVPPLHSYHTNPSPLIKKNNSPQKPWNPWNLQFVAQPIMVRQPANTFGRNSPISFVFLLC